MRGNSLLKITIEGNNGGEETRGRPRMILLKRIMREDYSKLERAGQCDEWTHWTYESS